MRDPNGVFDPCNGANPSACVIIGVVFDIRISYHLNLMEQDDTL